MQRRNMFKIFSAFLASSALPASSVLAAAPFPLKKTEAQWRAIVSPAAYEVLFDHGTERAGSSPLDDEKRPGTFICAACNHPLSMLPTSTTAAPAGPASGSRCLRRSAPRPTSS